MPAEDFVIFAGDCGPGGGRDPAGRFFPSAGTLGQGREGVAADSPWRVGFVRDGQPEFIDVATPAEATAANVAEMLTDAMSGAGWQGGDVLLALSSRSCLCGNIPLEGLPRRDRRRAMLYRLEESLPLAAEDLIADFIPHPGGVTGVCVENAYVAPLVEALAARAVDIAAVCPRALLALGAVLRESDRADGASRTTQAKNASTSGAGRIDRVAFEALICQDGCWAELFLLSDGSERHAARFRAWYTLCSPARDASRVLTALTAAGNAKPLRLAVRAQSPALAKAIDRTVEAGAVEVVAPPAADAPWCPEQSMEVLALAEAGRILRGEAEPPVELHPGGAPRSVRFRAAGRPFAFAASAAALLCACVVGGLLWRAGRYAQLVHHYEKVKIEAFRQAFPNQPAPEGIESRLRSAEHRLRQPNVASAAGPADSGPSLLTLRAVLSRLPASVRYHLTEAQFDGPGLTLRGEVAAHADVYRLTSALAGPGGFQVDEPQTRVLGDGVNAEVEFVLTGHLVAPTSSAPAVVVPTATAWAQGRPR